MLVIKYFGERTLNSNSSYNVNQLTLLQIQLEV